MTSHFNRYQGMFVQPAFKNVSEYNDTFESLAKVRNKEKVLKQAKVAMAWGVPDNESLGMSHKELVQLVRQLVDIIEAQ